MAEDEKGTSSWYRVPVWDGSPKEWRRFKKEMSWWMASLDRDSCRKFNVAARWMLRQTGVVRARCEEFDPSELEGTPEVSAVDPATQQETVIEEADPFAGLRKLLKSLEELNGTTELDKKGDLRAQFYQELKRQPHERIAAFCTRFRTLCGEMRREGIQLPKEELGWFLRERLGLDPLRKQLLETALAGRESYEEVETECLRLFRDLHVADPLHRRSLDGKPQLLNRFLSGSSSTNSFRPPASSSGSSTFSAPRSFRSSSSVSSRFSRPGKPFQAKQAMVTEQFDEDHADEDEELMPDGDAADSSPNLEEVLQAEVEVLVSELQEAEDEGVEQSVLDEMELGVERAAESLLTMREARQKLNDVRKDRGFGGKGAATPKSGGYKGKAIGNIATARKQDPNNPCWDCGQPGHWLGDPQCPKPGAGLALPPGKKKAKQVKVVEHATEVTEFLPDEHVDVDLEATGNEVHVTESRSPKMSFDEALSVHPHEVQISGGAQLMSDKQLVGALDSACNRTCTGSVWLNGYLAALSHAPAFIKQLVTSVPEQEVFRFGNGGTQVSTRRWRVPIMVGSTLICVWISTVEVGSLGLLLGRDFLDAIGAVLSFSRKMLRADHLCGSLIRLRQLIAGHFALQLIPSTWPRPEVAKWRKLGADGVIEVQVDSKEWLNRRLAAVQVVEKPAHEHLITEHSERMADISLSGISSASDSECNATLARKMTQRSRSPNSKPLLKPLKTSPTQDDEVQGRKSSSALRKNGAAHDGARKMACARHLALACAATFAALRAFSVPLGWEHRAVAYSSRHDGCKWSPGQTTSGESDLDGGLHSSTSEGPSLHPRSARLELRFSGRPNDGRHAVGTPFKEDHGKAQGRCHRGSSTGSPKGNGAGQARRSSSQSSGTSRRPATNPWRSGEVGSSSSSSSGAERHRRPAQGKDQTHVGGDANEGSKTKDSHRRSVWELTRKDFSRSRCSERFRSDGLRDSGSTCKTDARSGAKIQEDDARHDALRPGLSSNGASFRRTFASSRISDDHVFRSGLGGHGGGGHAVHVTEQESLSNEPAVEMPNPWTLHQDLKKGQAALIAQAWEQHVANRKRTSTTSRHLQDVMTADWINGMQDAQNDVFMLSMSLPNPLVGEVYTSSQNVTNEARRRGHGVGTPMSLETGWGFRKASHRKQALELVRKEKPFCLMLAFPCGPWSPLMNLRPAYDLAQKRLEGKWLVKFALDLARLQKSEGRHYILENPLPSKAWTLAMMEKALAQLESFEARFDQCRLGLCDDQGVPQKKATRIATSSEEVAMRLDGLRCQKDHIHSPVIGGPKVTAAAGIYPLGLVRAIVDGVEAQFVREFRTPQEVLMIDDGDELVEAEMPQGGGAVQLWDDSASEEELVEEKSMKIPAGVKLAVKKLHESTGHRSNARLARALVLAGAPQEVIAAAKAHKCSLCDEKRAPKSRRPASLPRPRDISDQVHVDILEVMDNLDRKYYVIHIIDWSSRFQMARVLQHKSSKEIIQFLREHWWPIFGPPRVLVADQGREFISHEFEAFCSEGGTLLWHTAVQAPWQNGVCERGGGVLKCLIATLVKKHSVVNFEEMQIAVQESVMAYNHDVNEQGVSPAQAALGKQPRMVGDVLGGFHQRLSEHGLVDAVPHLSRRLALRETAKVAMLRLHFSRAIRRGELARSRSSTQSQHLEPGMIVYFWRETKYNAKANQSRKKLLLKRWHGPALLLALEGHTNAFVSFKGQMTKCALEHVRPASTMEQISAETWRDAIEDSVEAALHDLTQEGADVNGLGGGPDEPSLPRAPVPAVVPLPGLEETPQLTPSEIAAALQYGNENRSSRLAASEDIHASRRSSLLSSIAEEPAAGTPAPGTPVPDLILQASQSPRLSSERLDDLVNRARALDSDASSSGLKRPAEIPVDALHESEGTLAADGANVPAPVVSSSSSSSNEVLMMTREDWETVANDPNNHPLVHVQAMAELDKMNPAQCMVHDHGTWDGRWPMPTRSDWEAQETLREMWPTSSHEVYAAQTARKELKWTTMKEVDKPAFQEAANKGWSVWTENDAVQVLTPEASDRVVASLRAKGELHRILQPRWVFTDKNDGLRTDAHDLPVRASARLVVPGYKDLDSFGVRKDAPTASRTTQHMIFTYTACNYRKGWRLKSADIKAAFMKGELFEEGERELWISNVKGVAGEPRLPLPPGCIARLKKGIFGLADSPRRWYKRLDRALQELGWTRSNLDYALWFLWGEDGSLEGVIGSHVDDLLCGGGPRAMKLLDKLGEELGFGSLEQGKSQYCGKMVEQESDGTIKVSMLEYHSNLKPVPIPADRKKDFDSDLSPSEHKQLRGILGSLQWLVTQVRFDQSFALSVLQSEKPKISTLLKANALLRKFKERSDFALYFRPFDLAGSGIMVVTDASLGNVKQDGSVGEDPIERVFSQSAYMVLLGDENLIEGKSGKFAVIDSRSHRIGRVCRSTYGAELLGAEEGFDVGHFVRGVVAEFRGIPVLGRRADGLVETIDMTVVTDAKDVYDRCSSDTNSYGSQKSLAFTIAWLRSMLQRPQTRLRWTSTQNMFVDCGTKEMDVDHLHRILKTCEWSARYEAAFVKQGKTKSVKRVQSAPAILPGEEMNDSDPMFRHVMQLGDVTGWHTRKDAVIQVARNAKSFRTPRPRFKSVDYPLRTTFARFDSSTGSSWRRLETDVAYGDLQKDQGLIGGTAAILISCFKPPRSTKENDQLWKHHLILAGIFLCCQVFSYLTPFGLDSRPWPDLATHMAKRPPCVRCSFCIHIDKPWDYDLLIRWIDDEIDCMCTVYTCVDYCRLAGLDRLDRSDRLCLDVSGRRRETDRQTDRPIDIETNRFKMVQDTFWIFWCVSGPLCVQCIQSCLPLV